MKIKDITSLIACCIFANIALANTAYASPNDQTNTPSIQAALASLEQSLPGTLMNNPYDIQWKMTGADYKASIKKAPQIPGKHAYRIRVKKAKKESWEVAARVPVTKGAVKDDAILIAFWGKALKFDTSTGTAMVSVALSEKMAPYTTIASSTVMLAEHWQIHYLSGQASQNFKADEIELSFNVGTHIQTVELGQYYIMNLGQNADISAYPIGAVDP